MKKIIFWFIGGLIITIVFGTIYAVAQQSLRLGANDPQIQMAQDAALLLDQGKIPKDLVKGNIEINNSLAPFTIIYDKNGKVVAGNGYLNGQIPTVPLGVLINSNSKEYNFVTWQPQSDARIASVEVAANDYYVLSGRSLKEVEKRESTAFQLSFIGWLIGVALLLTAFVLSKVKSK